MILEGRIARPIGALTLLVAPLALVALLFLPRSDASAGVVLGFLVLIVLLMVPGVFIAAALTPTLDVTTLGLSAFAGYTVYGTIALTARVLGLGYDFLYIAFVLSTVGIILAYARCAAARTPTHLHWPSLGTLAIIVLVTATYFQFPSLNDQGIFDGNIFASRQLRNFAPSNTDVLPFGLTDPQPRMQANLYHAFYGVASELLDVGPRTLTMHVANPFVGFLALLLMTAFLWELCGRRIDPVFALAAVIAAFVFWFEPGNPYWYYFRLLNGATVDKDFMLFVLLPALTICAARYLEADRASGRGWLLLLACSAVTGAFSHPMTPTYLVINCGLLGVAFFRRSLVPRLVALWATVIGAFLLVVLVINPADTHHDIEWLAQYDLDHGGRMHYWGGHYVTPTNRDSSVAFFEGTSIPYVRPSHVFRSPWIRQSAIFALLWIAIRILGRVSQAFAQRERVAEWPPIGTEAISLVAVGTAAAAILLLDWPGRAPRLSVVTAAAMLGVLCLLATGAIAWIRGDRALADPTRNAEERALRLQTAAMAALVILYGLASVVLYHDIALWRGVDRLHWFYFGGLSVAFVLSHGFDVARALIAGLFDRLRPGRGHTIAPWLAALPYFTLGLIVTDQAIAAGSGSPSVAFRTGLLRPHVDHAWFRAKASQLRPWIDERGPGDAPDWLRDDDRVLCFNYLYEYIFPIRRRLVYYRELYSEGYAYQYLGVRLLDMFHAYNALQDGEITDTTLSFLHERKVSVIILGGRNANLEDALRERWPAPVTRIAPDILRLGRPRDEHRRAD